MRYNTLIFDLDGTLADPEVGITRCVQYALAKMGIEEPDPTVLRPYIGPPLAQSFQAFHGLSAERAWQAVEAYRERFATTGMHENVLYPGVAALLTAARERGFRVALATSKLESYTEQILENFGIRRLFDFVAGSLYDGTRAAKGEVIRHVLDSLSVPAAACLMIGDTKYDMIGAAQNGMDCVAVSYGHGDWAETLAARPTYTCDSIEALRDLLASL